MTAGLNDNVLLSCESSGFSEKVRQVYLLLISSVTCFHREFSPLVSPRPLAVINAFNYTLNTPHGDRHPFHRYYGTNICHDESNRAGKARRSGTAASPWAVDVIGNRGKVQAAATYLKQKEKCRCEQVIFSTDTRISLYYSRFLLRFPAPPQIFEGSSHPSTRAVWETRNHEWNLLLPRFRYDR